MVGGRVLKLLTRSLKKELSGKMTNAFIKFLLKAMDTVFCLYEDYRKKNIENFKGGYLFETADKAVSVSATFENGDMKLPKEARNDWDVRVTFKDSAALRSFIFSGDQDILDSLLKNEVEVDGNLNYVYKFGFMARDLAHRLGVK
jgi:hypothetical protein